MTTWNHRVIMHVDVLKEGSMVFYEIAEVYYNSKGKPIGRASASVCGENVKEMKWTMDQMKKAMKHPVLLAKKIKRKDGSTGEKLVEVKK